MRASLFFILILLTGCAISNKRISSHLLVKPPADKQLAASKRKDIVSISNNLFGAGEFTGNNKELIRYRILAPDTVTAQKKYPLVLIFHNSGRIGTDNTAQLDVLVKFWAQDAIRKRYPAYVLAVQFAGRSSNYVKNADSVLTSVPAPGVRSAIQLVDSLKNALPVDINRIYTIGFSMGASTANNALMARPDLFAAGVFISGIPMQEGFFKLKNTPLWLIHGNDDQENPIPGDRLLYQKMQGLKSSKILFWEIEGLQHEIYTPLYTSDIIPQWLFIQTLTF
ncbi:phospholipase [Pedobacter cryoconitis]|uniref:Putative peptidase n=1 Tax=Pedobacter cryoconitis TaxID=188932 RepID=A0A7X0MII0_9SPHI|nr:phospholipase [Pedobacter cryoconitis]MBB6500179.1 putative peptidase [Pedobacter cryoconitis]